MKLIEKKCPQCGGALQVDENCKQAKCPYCDTMFFIDDEKQHLQLDGAEQAGYEFEHGRIRAQKEAEQKHNVPTGIYHPYATNSQYSQQTYKEQPVQYYPPAPKKRHLFWWVVGWLFCFPIPLSILIGRSKMPLFFKILLIGMIWSVCIMIGLANA